MRALSCRISGAIFGDGTLVELLGGRGSVRLPTLYPSGFQETSQPRMGCGDLSLSLLHHITDYLPISPLEGEVLILEETSLLGEPRTHSHFETLLIESVICSYD